MLPEGPMRISSLAKPHPFQKPLTTWREAALVSAIALSAIACIAQVFLGSFSVALIYGFLGVSAYLGYEAEKRVIYSIRKEQYYNALHKSTEDLREETLSFRSENQTLNEQVETLRKRLSEMEALLSKLDTSATLTKELLTSCVDVSSDQKKTEKRIHELLTRLERTTQVSTQKEIERHVSQLEKTIGSMEKQIKQFFLHDAKASNLLEVKREFSQTSQDLEKVKVELEKVQRELSETSARLEKNSYDIDEKLAKLADKEEKLSNLKKLTPLLIKILKKNEIHQKLSYQEKEQFSTLEKNWQSLLY
jgi:DNA repair exonuclease SbcCD ATPase subunit